MGLKVETVAVFRFTISERIGDSRRVVIDERLVWKGPCRVYSPMIHRKVVGRVVGRGASGRIAIHSEDQLEGKLRNRGQ